MKAADHLGLAARRAAWTAWYPEASFWQTWHMAMLNHGGMGNPPLPVSVMDDLYHPARPQRNPASTLLLNFEKRTLLGRLPPQTRLERTVPRSLLDACLRVRPEDLQPFWGNLGDHVGRHLTLDEQPHLTSAARAIRAEVRARGVDPDADPGFFPSAVTDVSSYAALARAILFLAVLAETPLACRLYCATNRSHAPPSALSLNLDVTESFLQSHSEPSEREVVLGLHLAIAEAVAIPAGNLYVPILNTEVSFSTLFAPTAPLSSRLRSSGRSAVVHLQ
jgi:hypothetical protein